MTAAVPVQVDPAHARAVVTAYVDAFARGDADAVAALYAASASVEDPVGTAPVVGRAAILAFYRAAMRTGATLALTGPVRVAADAAAFPFRVDLRLDGRATRIDVIDVFRFDAGGLIVSMQAYLGGDNIFSGVGEVEEAGACGPIC